MFTPIPDMPDDVVALSAHGEIHGDDYKKTFIPAVEEVIARTGEARVLLYLGPEWDGYSAAAMFDDAKLGLEHRSAWMRFALVSDADWVKHVATLFGWLVPGDVRWFPVDELDRAKTWVAER